MNTCFNQINTIVKWVYIRNLPSAYVLEILFVNNLLYVRNIYEQQSSFAYRTFHLKFKQCLCFKVFSEFFLMEKLGKNRIWHLRHRLWLCLPHRPSFCGILSIFLWRTQNDEHVKNFPSFYGFSLQSNILVWFMRLTLLFCFYVFILN